jgi:hypothetical protein
MKFLRHETEQDTTIGNIPISKGTPVIEIEGLVSQDSITVDGDKVKMTLFGTNLRRLFNVAFGDRRKQKPGGTDEPG